MFIFNYKSKNVDYVIDLQLFDFNTNIVETNKQKIKDFKELLITEVNKYNGIILAKEYNNSIIKYKFTVKKENYDFCNNN